jgi:hypothetical protein
MSQQLSKYREDISKVFQLGVEILKNARALKGISLDLKLLAVNGIVQAGKIGSAQGQSLITLSGFLSDLPVQIAPELEDLELITTNLARQLTISLIAIIRFLFYSNSLGISLDRILIASNSSFRSTDFKLLNMRELATLSKNELLTKTDEMEKLNIDQIAKVNIGISEKTNVMLDKSLDLLNKAEAKIQNLKRNGFIANYMGSNILIESSYLTTDQKSFQALVANIRGIVKRLDTNLDAMLNSIQDAENILKSVMVSNSRVN